MSVACAASVMIEGLLLVNWKFVSCVVGCDNVTITLVCRPIPTLALLRLILAPAALMLMGRFAIAVSCGMVESVTVTVTVVLPNDVGVPVTWPEVLIERPVGRPIALNVYGPVPPVAATVAAYATPVVPAGSELVVITNCGTIVREGLVLFV